MPDRELRALARALGCERRQVLEALQAAHLWPEEARPVRKLARQPAPLKIERAAPRQKRAYVRSRDLMNAYRLIPCQNCGRDDGTVCGAHSNWAVHGKCKSKKADDNRCASLCWVCHSLLDQGSRLTEDERKAQWWGAHVKTVMELAARGLWPPGVPVPNIACNPF